MSDNVQTPAEHVAQEWVQVAKSTTTRIVGSGIARGHAVGQWFGARHLLKHMLLVLLLISGIIFLTHYLGSYVDTITKEWAQHLQGTETALQFPDGSTVGPAEQTRLKQLFDTVRERRDLHLKVMNFYYAQFFIGIIVLSLMGGLAAILLVLIGKDGWQNTAWNSGKGLIVTAFVIVAAAAVYYNSWPGVFKQEQNISDNKVLLLQYLALENEMLSYAVTNEALNYATSVEDLQNGLAQSGVITATTELSATATVPPSNAQQRPRTIGKAISPKDFIHYVDLRLAKDNVAIGFDYNQVPNYDNIFGSP